MPVTLTKIGKTPGQTQFGLDTFIEHYKCDATADIVLTDASVPQKGDAHGTYGHMYLTDRNCRETGESASALDLVYMGSLTSSGVDPVLPPVLHEKDTQVMSASSSRSSGGATLSSPITVQFYAPTNRHTWFTSGAPSDPSSVPDPTDPIEVITLQVGDTSYSPGGLIDDIIAAYFTARVTKSFRAPEVVAGRYWQNQGQKTKCLVPWPFTASPGDYLAMFAPGTGYSAGNTLNMADGTGHAAVIVVSALGIGGSVLAWTVSSNSFNYTTPTPIYVSGGSGSGCAFYNYHIV